MAPDRTRRSQRGETLIESLVAITILSMVAAASFTGLRTVLGSSSQHKEGAVAETLLRSAAERIQDPDVSYRPDAGPCGGGPYLGLPTRTGYQITMRVRYWNAPSNTPTPAASYAMAFLSPTICPATDPGLQSITLSITTPSGFQQQLDVLKRAS